jgi:hypothetical protein
MQVIMKQQIEKCFLQHCHCITYELLNSKQKQNSENLELKFLLSDSSSSDSKSEPLVLSSENIRAMRNI